MAVLCDHLMIIWQRVTSFYPELKWFMEYNRKESFSSWFLPPCEVSWNFFEQLRIMFTWIRECKSQGGPISIYSTIIHFYLDSFILCWNNGVLQRSENFREMSLNHHTLPLVTIIWVKWDYFASCALKLIIQ